ncbi:MAG: thioredoxin domain-containing protein, partial [Alphaproteobacteria bacterium]|nr:thioredoxin domain-containing protein [Alphaproteobacteria bacterium]
MEAAKRYGVFAVAAVVGLAGLALGEYALLAWMASAVLFCLAITLLAPRWGVLSTALLGLVSSGYLFQRKLDTSGASICNVSSTINCDVVNSSPASMAFGLPIALLGTAFFLGVAAASFMTPSKETRLYQPVAIFGALGTLYSVYLGYQAYLIGAVCVMCMTIYACNVLLIVAGVLGSKEEVGSFADGLAEIPKSSGWMVVAAVYVVVVLLGQSYWKSHAHPDAAALLSQPRPTAPAPGQPTPTPTPAPQGGMEPNLYASPGGPVALEGDEPVLGNPNGKYQIVEYADFMCPHCAQAFP